MLLAATLVMHGESAYEDAPLVSGSAAPAL